MRFVKHRIVFAAVLTTMSGALGRAEPCNPAVDGTYCATANIRPDASRTRTTSSNSIQFNDLGASLSSMSYDRPATIGAITFSGDGSRCIGILRRVNCK
jgi:hypothetical protein